MEFDPTRPIYRQIMEEVVKRAVRGIYAPGAPLPSVRDMASQMGVNPNTMARAYQELERQGFTHTRRGEGSFITGRRERIEAERNALAEAACVRFATQLRDLALEPSRIRSLLRRVEEEVTSDGGRRG